MRILHIGGYHSVVEALAAEQRGLGHEAVTLGASTPDNYLQIPSLCDEVEDRLARLSREHFDIVQFHIAGAAGALDDRRAPLIYRLLGPLKARGARFYLYCYSQKSMSTDGLLSSIGLDRSMLPLLSHIFIAGPDSEALTGAGVPWSWLGMGFSFKRDLPVPDIGEPAGRAVRILHIPFACEEGESERITAALNAVPSGRWRFEMKTADTSTVREIAALRSCLAKCDLFVERLQGCSYGVLALEAMAQGKTVMSCNPAQYHSQWEQLSMCPVMDVNGETLRKRVESILLEPRCLRDLGRRSRQYVEKYHNAETINRLMMAVYEKGQAPDKPGPDKSAQ